MKKKGIVFINQSASYITKDIINVFAEKIDNVVLITGHISETGEKLNPKVKIHKIIRYNRKNLLTRSLSWLIATIQAISIINLEYRKYHLFITSNPPITVFIPLFCRNSYSSQILDIYPDCLKTARFISEKSIIYRLWFKRNIYYFDKAEAVFTISNEMANTLNQYCNNEKIKVIYQWSSFCPEDRIEDKSKNIFIKQYGLKGKFIVLYSGNLGLGHSVETIVEVAKILNGYNEILFLIIGEGWKKDLIISKIKEYKLRNCLILPYQSAEMFLNVLSAADIAFVTSNKEVENLSIPIKTYNLISMLVPLIALASDTSELGKLVKKYNIGVVFNPDDVNNIANHIITLKNNQLIIEEYREYLKQCSKYFSRKNAYHYLPYINV